MASKMPESFTRFLDLPREIRDFIYEHILVRDAIPIEYAIAKIDSSYSRSSENLGYLAMISQLRTTRAQRRLWSIPAFDMDLDYLKNETDAPRTVYMTYQIARSERVASVDGLNLHILRVSRQVYAEASKVFYSNNIFSFTGRYRIPTAFAFLCDRPAASLRLIRSMELALMEDTNMRGTAQAHYPIIRRSTDSLVLQYAYHYFTELCTLLTTSRIQLRKLYLTIETCGVRVSSDADLQGSAIREKQNLKGPIEIPLWLDPLLNIEGLESIELYWISPQARILRMAHTAGKMQQQMLAKAHNNGVLEHPIRHASPTIRFRVSHKTEHTSSLVSQDSSTWEVVLLDGDETQCVGLEEIEPNKSSQPLELPYYVQRILEIATEAYVCCCTMKCT
jgi:hypothetical protein